MHPNMFAITLESIQAAHARLAGAILRTACGFSPNLSELTGFSIYCKAEYQQRTGSFKERGARNALLLLTPEQKRRGVIAASAGNHALGLAYHGRDLGIPVTVVMPSFAPIVKSKACRAMGARVIEEGGTFHEARAHAAELEKRLGLTYINGFDAPAVIAGQGTVGLEILQQVPAPDAVIVPVGGGGLIAGIAVAIKSLRPETEIIAVEPDHAPSFTAAMAQGHPVQVPTRATLADGLAVAEVGANAFEAAHSRVDRTSLVSEQDLALAIVQLMQRECCVVEGSAAACLAATYHGALDHLKGKKVVLVLGGGNIDLTTLGAVIERGLVRAHQLCRFRTIISDRPGGLARFAAVISSTGASIKQVEHDRAFSGSELSTVNIVCTVELREADQIEELFAKLREAGMQVTGEM